MRYRVIKLKDQASPSAINLVQALEETRSAIESDQHRIYGVFNGLFGLASNELYCVLMSDDHVDDPVPQIGKSLTVMDSIVLTPTVRPTEHVPRTRAGIYVFRWFSVANKNDVEEIADLSRQAWTTFERDFGVEAQGLWVEADPSAENCTMLLITWYTNLTVWEASRNADSLATANFRRRQTLTTQAYPVCTRLHLPE
jgi:hypothetical protein